MRAVIVDDEYYAIQGLKMELADIGGIEIVGMYEDGAKMLAEIAEIRPDVIFLDIEMPQMNGFELVEKLLAIPEIPEIPNIVFVTAYSSYAVKAFEINAMDYIIKPVTKSRLLKTLERIQPLPLSEKEHSLQIHCFRHFSIRAGGKDINSGWRTRKAEELIAFLLAEKGNYIAKEKIAEALWPQQDRESAMSNLYMACYYIKKQESKNGVSIPIESERGKMRINTDALFCDFLEFNRLIDAAKEATAAQAAAYLERAAQLYQGLPFEDCYYAWANMLQSHYEYRYMELLESLVEYYRSNGNEKKASYYGEMLQAI